MHPGVPIALVFLGCCSNVLFLEAIVKEHPGAGNVITFMQFLFIAAEGLVFTTKFMTVPSNIPLKNYVFMVSMFFVVQVINNMVFRYNIPVTLHIIFRGGSLIASLILGVVILKRKYPTSKYLSVIMITSGIIICTMATVTYDKSHEKDTGKEVSLLTTSIGVLMLCFSLFMTSRMGIFQEQVYAKFGKHPKEALFYNFVFYGLFGYSFFACLRAFLFQHAMPLPGFLLVSTDIYSHILLFNQSTPVSVIGFGIPYMWLLLIGNVITQYICIRSVFILTTECSALTVTLVVTLRKFMSLIFSILYFQNPFTGSHWIGAALVFIGTFMFTDVIPLSKLLPKQKAK